MEEKSVESGQRGRGPGGGLSVEKMPGHWLLARLGKRVLRPGGLELTRRMLDGLEIGAEDDVVEFAPGLGATARLALACGPVSYTGVERDAEAARKVREYLEGEGRECIVGDAEETGLADGCASVVYGEAMLTMQREPQKRRIVGEAYRLLRPGGRYGIHELCLVPDELGEEVKDEIRQSLSRTIHVGARPLTPSEWRTLLESGGFEVRAEMTAPMHLLEPKRFVQDEGVPGALRFVKNVARDGEARKRVLAMRRLFRRYQDYLSAIAIVARKPEG
jgi:SAM-dependent methyltransferase